ncbi:DUF2059 domain-containing protein [Puniceicoccaceae bacterium K14]|nr:DUF2059 domain-containing protein [Puniceicoccaceae bacterium K14]
MKKLITLFTILITILGSICQALEDTPENRMEQAIRYSKITPITELLGDSTYQISLNLPPEQRDEFIDLMTKHLDVATLNNLIIDLMATHFTANKLSALAEFYGSEIGKSAMKKIGVYMADAMPLIQSEILKAQAEAVKAQAEANRLKEEK